jgi:hypothetical protein
MSDKSRRKLLKSIAAGSGAVIAGKSLPESWSKPVVDSVILPAHAQTSQAPLGYSTNQFSVASIEPGLQELLIPTAHAGFGIPDGILVVVFEPNLSAYDAWFQDQPQNQAYIGSGSGTTQTSLIAQCFGDNVLLTLNSGPNVGGIGFSLGRVGDNQVFTGTVMPDNAPPSPPNDPC